MKQSLKGTRKAVLLAIILVSVFVFLLLALVLSYQQSHETTGSLLSQFHLYFMIAMGAFGVAVGATVFYLMSQKVEQTQTTAKTSSEMLLRFLSKDEQFVVTKLLEHDGKILQSTLTREPGMSRLRVHRVVSKLSERGIITTSAYGKTNVIELQKDVRDSLS